MSKPNGSELLQQALAMRTQEQWQTFLMSLSPEERDALAAEARVAMDRIIVAFQSVGEAFAAAAKGFVSAWNAMPEETRAELERAAQEQEGGAT